MIYYAFGLIPIVYMTAEQRPHRARLQSARKFSGRLLRLPYSAATRFAEPFRSPIEEPLDLDNLEYSGVHIPNPIKLNDEEDAAKKESIKTEFKRGLRASITRRFMEVGLEVDSYTTPFGDDDPWSVDNSNKKLEELLSRGAEDVLDAERWVEKITSGIDRLEVALARANGIHAVERLMDNCQLPRMAALRTYDPVKIEEWLWKNQIDQETPSQSRRFLKSKFTKKAGSKIDVASYLETVAAVCGVVTIARERADFESIKRVDWTLLDLQVDGSDTEIGEVRRKLFESAYSRANQINDPTGRKVRKLRVEVVGDEHDGPFYVGSAAKKAVKGVKSGRRVVGSRKFITAGAGVVLAGAAIWGGFKVDSGSGGSAKINPNIDALPLVSRTRAQVTETPTPTPAPSQTTDGEGQGLGQGEGGQTNPNNQPGGSSLGEGSKYTPEQVKKDFGGKIDMTFEAGDTVNAKVIEKIKQITGVDMRQDIDPTGALDWRVTDALAKDSGMENGQALNLVVAGSDLSLEVGPRTAELIADNIVAKSGGVGTIEHTNSQFDTKISAPNTGSGGDKAKTDPKGKKDKDNHRGVVDKGEEGNRHDAKAELSQSNAGDCKQSEVSTTATKTAESTPITVNKSIVASPTAGSQIPFSEITSVPPKKEIPPQKVRPPEKKITTVVRELPRTGFADTQNDIPIWVLAAAAATAAGVGFGLGGLNLVNADSDEDSSTANKIFGNRNSAKEKTKEGDKNR